MGGGPAAAPLAHWKKLAQARELLCLDPSLCFIMLMVKPEQLFVKAFQVRNATSRRLGFLTWKRKPATPTRWRCAWATHRARGGLLSEALPMARALPPAQAAHRAALGPKTPDGAAGRAATQPLQRRAVGRTSGEPAGPNLESCGPLYPCTLTIAGGGSWGGVGV